jgi:hypothetical protein
MAEPRNTKTIRVTVRTGLSLYSAVSDTWKFARWLETDCQTNLVSSRKTLADSFNL